MRRLRVVEFLSLDGVMQGPGSPDEDRDGGFEHGGWQPPYLDETLGAAAGEGMAATDAYLFGRRTYEKMAAYWPTAPSDDPFARHLNSTTKYVASRTMRSADWEGTQVLGGDLVEEVTALKSQPGGNIAVLGSGELVQTLIGNDLVDEYWLAVFPLLLGGGKRLFRDTGRLQRLRLTNTLTTSTGGVVLTYEPEERTA